MMIMAQSTTILATLVILTLSPAASLQAAPAGTAGRYHVTFELSCRNAPQNAHACVVADNQQYTVFGRTGITVTLTITRH